MKRFHDPKVFKSQLQRYQDTGYSVEEVQYLAKAADEGRLKVLPCKAGDPVYKWQDDVLHAGTIISVKCSTITSEITVQFTMESCYGKGKVQQGVLGDNLYIKKNVAYADAPPLIKHDLKSKPANVIGDLTVKEALSISLAVADERAIIMPCKLKEHLYGVGRKHITEYEFWGVQYYQGWSKPTPMMYLKPLKYIEDSSMCCDNTADYSDWDDNLTQIDLSEYGKSVFRYSIDAVHAYNHRKLSEPAR